MYFPKDISKALMKFRQIHKFIIKLVYCQCIIMKGVLMRNTPQISDLHAQTLYLTSNLRGYESHRKKLESIRTERRNYLGATAIRNSQINLIRSNHSKSFAHKFNENLRDV